MENQSWEETSLYGKDHQKIKYLEKKLALLEELVLKPVEKQKSIGCPCGQCENPVRDYFTQLAELNNTLKE